VEFEGSFSAEEINDAVAVMEKLLHVREVILRVNQQYVASAAMEDAYRVEPPFKLQGSYRNMNKIAEKILPLMTDGSRATDRRSLSRRSADAQRRCGGQFAQMARDQRL
jgi:hypothetical protein